MSYQIARKGGEHDLPSILLGQLTRLDGAIEKEFTLIADRMTWMVVSESFIFGAFVNAAVYYDPGKTSLKFVVVALLIVLPMVGILIAAFAYRAILAAHVATDRLKEARAALEKSFQGPLQVELVSSKLDTHSQGNLPSRYLPPIFILSWCVFFAVVVAQLFATRSVIEVVAASSLVALFGIVFYTLRRTVVKQVLELEERLRALEARLRRVESRESSTSGGA